jgi:hypothetical protein
MIELRHDELVFRFPELTHQPSVTIDFQRTLRIPDDGKDHPLPPGFGQFPLRHIDDFARWVPPAWLDRGGLIMPMWQAEALWLYFRCDYDSDREVEYPFAIKVATGKVSAITGEQWQAGLRSKPQNYMVAPKQPWMDGYCVEKGIIRQFVAMPLGEGYSAEEQLTGNAEFGGIQVEVFPMSTESFERRFPKIDRTRVGHLATEDSFGICFCPTTTNASMGLAPGGRMRQQIYDDPYSVDDWDTEHGSRCFIHLVNSVTWQAITGEKPPTRPPTAKDYTEAGYPWFDYYDHELKALEGAGKLASLKSVKKMGQGKRTSPLPENESVVVTNLVNLRAGLKPDQVRESSFEA